MILRAKKTKNYTVMSNVHLHDERLSLKAKGLLSMCLSFDDNWDFSINGLIAISKENRTAIMSALNELKECGYLTITEERTSEGKFDYVYTIFENPQEADYPYIEKPHTENLYTDKPITEKPYTEKPHAENVQQINTNIINTNKTKTKESNTNKKYSAMDSIADDKLRKALEEFISNRKEMRRPVTDKALELTIKKLYKLADNNDDRIAIIEQSIENGWMGVFPLKEDKKKKPDKMDKYRKIMGEL